MMRNTVCDLHTHSVFSDGTKTPQEIIDMAVEAQLSAVALCDHNTVDGLPDFLQAAEGKPVEAIPGAEFSVDFDGTELHLLGLFIQSQCFAQVSELMEQMNLRKEQSNLDLAASLNRAGYRLDYAAIKAQTPNGMVNRAHFAAELTRLGYTESIDHAFRMLLRPAAGYYVEPERFMVWEMLDFLQSIHAALVLAHPFLNLNKAALQAFLPIAKQRGLLGMEVLYSTYDDATTADAMELATQFGLQQSGGSDFHGANKPDIRLGVGRGNLRIPGRWAEELKSLI